MISEVAEDATKFNTFYENFAKSIKLGVNNEDDGQAQKLASFLRYNSLNHTDKMITFDEYLTEATKDIEEDKKVNTAIYYIAGDKDVQYSPCLELFKKKSKDVLLLVDPLDEYAVTKLKKYKDNELTCVTKDGVKLDNVLSEEEKKEKTEQNTKFEGLCKKIKEILKSSVEKVVISDKVTESPCAITSGQFGYSANMERILKAQALRDNNMLRYMQSKKILEINPKDELINKIKEKSDLGEKIDDLVIMMFDTALLTSGFTLENPARYAKKIYNVMKLYSGIETSNPIEASKEELTEKDTTDNSLIDQELEEDDNDDLIDNVVDVGDKDKEENENKQMNQMDKQNVDTQSETTTTNSEMEQID